LAKKDPKERKQLPFDVIFPPKLSKIISPTQRGIVMKNEHPCNKK